ncbi:MAG: PAS domain-containing sensor histidine kinase [Myxococcales bacterium]|jgi:PAS domain S-box-containing protein
MQLDGVTAPLGGREVFERFFEDSNDAIIITDLGGRIARANRTWLRLHGFTFEEVRGKTTNVVKSEHTSREMYEHMWAQIRDPEKGWWKGEIVNRARDGREIPLLLTISPIRRGLEMVGYAGVGIDISERKQVEELKRLYDLVVWHDLKSPLGAMLSLLDTLLGGYAGELGAQQRELVERARAQGGRMSELIATSLDLEKLKRRKLNLEIEPVEIVGVLRASFETLQKLAARKGVLLELKGAAEIVWPLDALHFRRCTENLIKNAIEASPAGALVWASAERTADGARLRVHNGGKPIPPDVRATLFHPFGTYGKKGGTGLGIYGVKMLVEAMGGRIGYQTGEEGTTFEIAFGGEAR